MWMGGFCDTGCPGVGVCVKVPVCGRQGLLCCRKYGLTVCVGSKVCRKYGLTVCVGSTDYCVHGVNGVNEPAA